MSWKQHIDIVSSKISKSIGIHYKSKDVLSKQCLKQIYISFIHNYVNHANIAWANISKSKRLRWRNWIKTWAGALLRFFGTEIGVYLEKNSITTITHFLQLILIWVRNINGTCVFIMKPKAQFLLLPKNMVQFFISRYHLLSKIIIRNIPWQNLSNFLSVVLEKYPVKV